MQALLEDMKSGEILTCEVPIPELRPGGLLVSTRYSAISTGTERVKVEMGAKSLVQKALARPDLVKQVLEHAQQNGVRAAYQKVQARLDTYTTMGYSAAGVVLRVADDVSEFRPGDRVACAGAGCANHCQVNFIPRNLAVKVPDRVSLEAASLTTIGAIALQGLRQAQVAVGECIAVIGAGLVGVLAIQLARASGCRVLAIDLDADRASRAVEFGAHLSLTAGDARIPAVVQEFSRYGVDAAIITAATSSSEPLELAARILRDRGRVVVVGDVGMGVSRAPLYAKELSILMSRSYGPGRYDPEYEEHGHDYPIGYVRWTERRNMEAFLDLLAEGTLDLTRLLEHRVPIQEGPRAYDELRKNGAYTVILEFANLPEAPADRPRKVPLTCRLKTDILRVGCIGAGGFARSTIFPALRAGDRVVLQSVASASGIAAESARRAFGFRQATTTEELQEDPDVDAVFVVSRHDSHAGYAARALAAGKHVFVEKPLAVTPEQLGAIEQAHAAWIERREAPPCLMVGFNRRFAPATDEVRRFFTGRREPMFVHIRVNAGYQPPDHWVHADGGRIIGELCHFVDWARAVVASPISEVSACGLPNGARYHCDNLAVTLRFADGSLANLLYLANGDPGVPKEYFEVFCEGAVARLEDFRGLALSRSGKSSTKRSRQDKGHRCEIECTVQAMRNAAPAPIPFDELLEVTRATFAVHESLATGQPIHLRTPSDPVTDCE
jgi:predicted dehydrogenase/threonine dehydrogenase-like Zn-dependent dehydrogenase